MVNVKELAKFAQLPPVFNRQLLKLVESEVDKYDECRGYIRGKLEYFGDDGFKNPDAYTQVGYDIQNENLPKPFEEKLLAVLELMKGEYCN